MAIQGYGDDPTVCSKMQTTGDSCAPTLGVTTALPDCRWTESSVAARPSFVLFICLFSHSLPFASVWSITRLSFWGALQRVA
jgi:hypothetical protein